MRAGDAALGSYLRQAYEVLAAAPDRLDDGPTGLPADFEALRWFPLPAASLTATPATAAAIADAESPRS